MLLKRERERERVGEKKERMRVAGMFLNVREKKKIKKRVGVGRDRLDTCVEEKNKKKEMKTYG